MVALSRVPGPTAMAEAQAQLQSLLAAAQSGELSLLGLRAARGEAGSRVRGGAPWSRSHQGAPWQGEPREQRPGEGAHPAALASEGLAQERLAGLLGAMGRAGLADPGAQALPAADSRQAGGLLPADGPGQDAMAPRLRYELRAACNSVLNAISREGDLRRAITVMSQVGLSTTHSIPQDGCPYGGSKGRPRKEEEVPRAEAEAARAPQPAPLALPCISASSSGMLAKAGMLGGVVLSWWDLCRCAPRGWAQTPSPPTPSSEPVSEPTTLPQLWQW